MYIMKEEDVTKKLREGQVVIGTKGHQRDCNGDTPERTELAGD